MGNLKDFRFGYDTALNKALAIVRESGVEGLETEIQLRQAQSYKGALLQKECDMLAQEIYWTEITDLTMTVMAALHDEFGFGPLRMKKLMTRIVVALEYMERGWMKIKDMEQELRTRVGPEVVEIVYKTRRKSLAHPMAEDIYQEPDFVDQASWNTMLKDLGFSERDKVVYDQNGKVFSEYISEPEKAMLYDMMIGVEWGKNHDWNRKEPEPNPPVSKPVRNRRKKKR